MGVRRTARDAMDAIEAIRTRRSIRSYLTRPVERNLIEQIIWDAAQAPPPRRGQVPWTFNVFEGPDRISAYGDRAGENLILSAHARGLGACWVGSPLLWLRTASIKAELGIPPDLVPGAAICLGYPRSIPEVAPHEWPTIIWAK